MTARNCYEGKRVAEHLVRSLANSIEAKEVQARFEYEFGETTKAEQLWQEIIAVNPNYVYALKGLGDVANLNGKLEESVGYYRRRGVLADPNDLTLQVLLGVSLLNASQFNEAKQTLESVLAGIPAARMHMLSWPAFCLNCKIIKERRIISRSL